jgi:hypothetical protein
MKVVKGNQLKFIVAAKGCGSENKAKFAVLQPDDNVVEWILKMVPTMGAGWCPPRPFNCHTYFNKNIDNTRILTQGALTNSGQFRID